METRKNILLLTSQMSLGGAEKVFYDHIVALSRTHNVIVCLFTKKGFYEGFAIPNLILELDTEVKKSSIARWRFRKHKLEDIFKAHAIDCCISHMEGPNMLNCITSAKAVNKILCVHGSIMADSSKSKFKIAMLNKFLLPFFYSKADTVVAVSNAMRLELNSIGISPAKTKTINNFFDVEGIQQKVLEPSEYSTVVKDGYLVNVGRLAYQKNQAVLLRVMAQLRKNGRNEKLVVVGDGHLRDFLIQFARSLNLSVYSIWEDQPLDDKSDVYFIGQQRNPYRIVRRASLFVLTSFFEGFPLVLGESLACGTPIVSVDCHTGPREILTDDEDSAPRPITAMELGDSGVLMPDLKDADPGEAMLNEWCKAITTTLDNEQLMKKMQQKGGEKVKNYGEEKIMNQWLKLIADGKK